MRVVLQIAHRATAIPPASVVVVLPSVIRPLHAPLRSAFAYKDSTLIRSTTKVCAMLKRLSSGQAGLRVGVCRTQASSCCMDSLHRPLLVVWIQLVRQLARARSHVHIHQQQRLIHVQVLILHGPPGLIGMNKRQQQQWTVSVVAVMVAHAALALSLSVCEAHHTSALLHQRPPQVRRPCSLVLRRFYGDIWNCGVKFQLLCYVFLNADH